MSQPRVLVGVTGGIAAYKAVEVVRLLQKRGADVHVAMTKAATHFVGPLTFKALTGYEVALSLFTDDDALSHITLADSSDLIIVVPATAQTIMRIAHGAADDILSATVLAATSPIVVAPAMNVHMYENSATQQNLRTLIDRGIHVIEPDSGPLACGYEGRGKLGTPESIVEEAWSFLDDRFDGEKNGPLTGRHVVVTAGPTYEAIDPVRYIGNRSSGKMGYAIARELRAAGADVTLISGPTALAEPAGITMVHIESAQEMLAAALSAFEEADAAICTAAVSDYAPAEVSDRKLKKSDGALESISLVENPDILRTLADRKGDRVVVGFAAETHDLLAHAKQKLESKGADLIVANDVSKRESTFGSDTNVVTFVDADGVRELPELPKDEVAREIVGELVKRLG